MSTHTTINGLHSCKQGNEPQVGQVKTFVIEQKTGKSGKAYLRIKNAGANYGGTPHRILSASPTGHVDDRGNHSFNLEIEEATATTHAIPPSAFQQARSAMQPPKEEQERDTERMFPSGSTPGHPINEPQPPPARSNGGDGVSESRKRLCQVANLYALCVRCANSRMIADEIPDEHKRNEQFQSTLASIWIYMSSRRSDDGVTWWDYTDKMPTTPIKAAKANDDPRSVALGALQAVAADIQERVCTCENTEGDNPLCPIHST